MIQRLGLHALYQEPRFTIPDQGTIEFDKILFGDRHMMLRKNPNEIVGQVSKIHKLCGMASK